MKTRKLIIKTLTLFASFIFVCLLTNTSVKAMYDKDLNTVTEYKVNRSSGKIDMTFKYQYGIRNVEVFICNLNAGEQACMGGNGVVLASSAKSKYTDTSSNVNRNNEVKSYAANLQLSLGVSVAEYPDKFDADMKPDNRYTIMVKASFCTTRKASGNECLTWSPIDLVLNDTFDLSTGLTNSAELNNTIAQVLNITHSIVIPVLWVLLGALLIIRGVILAIGIVKSSDEPEVRKQKINGMIWLVVGVVIGYVVTVTARIVMGIFGYGGYF